MESAAAMGAATLAAPVLAARFADGFEEGFASAALAGALPQLKLSRLTLPGRVVGNPAAGLALAGTACVASQVATAFTSGALMRCAI